MVAVREATTADLGSVPDALAAAFHDDPVMLHILRRPAKRARQMRTLFRGEARRALDKGRVLTTDGRPGTPAGGGSVWVAPDKWRLGGIELLGQVPVLLSFGRDTKRSLQVLSHMERVHPKEPHWYLAILGTRPEAQGKGVGSALLQPVLDDCDAQGLPAYLESSKEANIPFYRRHGFEVTGLIEVPGGPSLWPMWRDPR